MFRIMHIISKLSRPPAIASLSSLRRDGRTKNQLPADATDIEIVVLIVVVHIAIIEVHVPGVVAIVLRR